MTDDERNELLLRIDERTKTIMEKIKPMSCMLHQEKIRVLEKIIWGTLLIVITLTISTVWKGFAG